MMHWLIRLILGPEPRISARREKVDQITERAMKARQEALRMRFEVITRKGGR